MLVTEAEPTRAPGPRIVYVNPAFARMTGHEPRELHGHTPRVLQGPATEAEPLEQMRRAFARWRPVRVELTNYRRDGAPFAVELDIRPIHDETGWFVYWLRQLRRSSLPVRAEPSRLRRAVEAALAHVARAHPGGLLVEIDVAASEALPPELDPSLPFMAVHLSRDPLAHAAGSARPDRALGPGIGLALAGGVVGLHGGALWRLDGDGLAFALPIDHPAPEPAPVDLPE